MRGRGEPIGREKDTSVRSRVHGVTLFRIEEKKSDEQRKSQEVESFLSLTLTLDYCRSCM